MKLNQFQWEKLLRRWSDFPDCGEKRLVCAVIATAIVEEPRDAQRECRIEFEEGFWSRGFIFYCRLVHLDPEFVLEQIKAARAFNESSWRSWLEAA